MKLPRFCGDTTAGLAIVWTVLGAAYFGLWSCGNNIWKAGDFRFSIWALALAAVVLPSRSLPTLPRKLVFLLALWALYALVESAFAPFYPAAPASWRQYFEGFMVALEHGPCA